MAEATSPSETVASERIVNPSKQTSSLLINIEELLKLQGVEKQRLEFKKDWNKPKSPTSFQVIATISAFANDFYNDNGGYIVIGVEEDNSEDATSQIKLPPFGVKPGNLEKVQKQIMGACKGNITPAYFPILSPEIVDERHVLVIWAQASECRPHKARESHHGDHFYFIRKGPETVKATNDEIKELMTSSAKIPFDDRMARHESGIAISHKAINGELVKNFLDDIQSNVKRVFKNPMLTNLKLVTKHGDEIRDGRMVPRLVPINAALLMFNKEPEFYFHGAKIEIAVYSRDTEVQQETCITGPLDRQINQSIQFVLSTTNKEKSVGTLTYPERALREAIVNAVYHRGYEPEHNSPTKIHIRTHRLEIWSYPGPHQSLKMENFKSDQDIPLTPARNRRIGEFLKELKLAEARGTGVNTIFKTMKENENAAPQFEFDSSYFRVILPAHPKFQASMLMKEIEELEAAGETSQASKILLEAFDKDSSFINQALVEKLIFLHDGRSDHPNVQKYAEKIGATTEERCRLLIELERWLKNKKVRDSIEEGVGLILKLVEVDADADNLSQVTKFVLKLLEERDQDTRRPKLQSQQQTHRLLQAYGLGILSSNSTIAYYFARVELNIYRLKREERTSSGSRNRNARSSFLPYLTRARACLEQHVIVMSQRKDAPPEVAEHCRLFGYIMYYLCLEKKARTSDCVSWYKKARMLNPKIHIDTTKMPPENRQEFALT